MRFLCWIILVLLTACNPAPAPVYSPTSTPTPEPSPTGFVPPPREVREAAVGDLGDLADGLRACFSPSDIFAPIPEPGPLDWLAQQKEEGQTYDAFLPRARRLMKESRTRLYYQPIGDFTKEELEPLQNFGSRFFGVQVVILDPIGVEEMKVTSRNHPVEGQLQLLTGDILSFLRERVPADAQALLGITKIDLYPQDDWNFVFGMASLERRIGVYSFARYKSKEPSVSLLRSCKVLAHETGHMFGLSHCIYYTCLMNGSNHLVETDEKPLMLCPVCLRKLHFCLKFDPRARYRELLEFYRQQPFEIETDLLSRHLQEL